MKKFKYAIYSNYTAGLQFAIKAFKRDQEVRIISHINNPFNTLYEKSLPGKVLYFSEIQDHDLYQEIKNYSPDFLVSLVFDKKIPDMHIKLIKGLAVNIHPSRLPQIRTGDSLLWNILLEENIFEITMHKLTDKWDNGDVLFKDQLPLNRLETSLSMIKKVEKYMIKHAQKFQEVLEQKKYILKPQGIGNYYPQLRGGFINLSFEENPDFIERIIRYSNDQYMVQVRYKNYVIRLIEVELTRRNSSFPAGTLEVDRQNLFLHTIGRIIRVQVMHCSNYGYLSSKRFILQYRPKTREKFIPINDNNEVSNKVFQKWLLRKLVE